MSAQPHVYESGIILQCAALFAQPLLNIAFVCGLNLKRQAAVREFICTVKVHRWVAAASRPPDRLSASLSCAHQLLVCIHPSTSFFFYFKRVFN